MHTSYLKALSMAKFTHQNARFHCCFVGIIIVLCLWLVHGSEARSTVVEAIDAQFGELKASNATWDLFGKFVESLKGFSSYLSHIWPEIEIGWRIIVGTLIAFWGAAFGSAGGIGAGGIFVPMLSLVIGFDPKSSAAISKCMIMGLSCATVYYNLKKRHPILQQPLIDYDLALAVQPMLLLGISTGVTLSVVLANWMITVLLIIALLGTSTRSLYKGVDMWKKETIQLQAEAQKADEILSESLLGGPREQPRVSLVENIKWKQLGILVIVWLAFLVIQIFKGFTANCSTAYWISNLLQIPVAVGATLYQAYTLANEEAAVSWMGPRQLVLCASVAMLAGTLGGLLGLGGGFILGPMFLEIGIIPQVSSATATFIMTFSASMCVDEYFLLDRFPLPYAAYMVIIAVIASLTGQYVVKKWIARAGRASVIVFILSSILFASVLLLGGEGIVDMVYKIKHNEYMGFEDLCTTA